MSATVEKLTDEVARELSDAELQDLATGDDAGNAEVAQATLAERNRTFGEQTAPAKGSKSEEVRQEGGEPTGAMPDSAPEDPLPDVDEIRIDGTAQLSAFNLGGKLPTGSSLALTGGKVALVDGQAFHKGDRVKLTIEAVVNNVGQKDAHDPKTGQVVSCEQQHKARIVDVQLDSAG